MKKNIVPPDERVAEKPEQKVATPPGIVLRSRSAQEPPEIVAVPLIGEQPVLPEFKPRKSKSGAEWFKSLID